MTVKDDTIRYLQYKTEKHDHEYILKSLKIDSEYYKRKYKNLNQKKVFYCYSRDNNRYCWFVNRQYPILNRGRSGSAHSCFYSILASMATLITNEYFSKIKIRYTKLRDHIIMITLLYEKNIGKIGERYKNGSFRIKVTQKNL